MRIIRHKICPIYNTLPFAPNLAEPIDWLLQLASSWDVSLPLHVMCHLIPVRPETVVIDPFVGAGATLLAADRLTKNCLGSDIEPLAVVSSFTKICTPTVMELVEAAETLTPLVSEDLTEMPIGWDLGSSLWVNCAVVSMVSSWILSGLPADSPRRHHSVKRLQSTSFPMKGMAKVLLADVRSEYLWQFAADSLGSADWLILTSPPFPNSRKGFLINNQWLQDVSRRLAEKVTEQYIGPRATLRLIGDVENSPSKTWHTMVLDKVAAYCCGTASVVAEYEVAHDEWFWLETVEAAARDGCWGTVELLPLYEDSPDGRPGVTEGGLLIARR